MRILFLSGEYPPQPGGVGDYTQCLAAALYEGGHAVAVLTIQAGQVILYDPALQDERDQSLDNKTVISTAGGSMGWSWRSWPAVIKALDVYRPDWLHIQYQTGAYAMHPAINLLPRRLRALPGRPRIAVTFHDLLVPYLFPKAGPLRRLANLELARSADALITTNAGDTAQLHGAGLHPTQIPIGSNIAPLPPPGYDRRQWRAQLGVGDNELLVAYFGLLAANKGVDLLFDALQQIKHPWRLLLIGGAATAPQDVAYAADVQRRIAQQGLDERVIATGHVDPEQVSAHLLAADLVGLPFRDGASLRRGSLLAALAHGCAVITTQPQDAEAASLIRNECEALLTPISAPAIAAALEQLAEHPDLRIQLGAGGKALAARYTWPAIASAHEVFYRQSVE